MVPATQRPTTSDSDRGVEEAVAEADDVEELVVVVVEAAVVEAEAEELDAVEVPLAVEVADADEPVEAADAAEVAALVDVEADVDVDVDVVDVEADVEDVLVVLVVVVLSARLRSSFLAASSSLLSLRYFSYPIIRFCGSRSGACSRQSCFSRHAHRIPDDKLEG